MFDKISHPLSHGDTYTEILPIRPAAGLAGKGKTGKHR